MADTIAMTDDTISEAAAENRPKRGRPRATPPEWDDAPGMAFLFAGKSRRTKIKGFHSAMALGALGKDERFRYIMDPDRPRWEILAELGRLDDDDRIREAAAYICEHEVKTKDAIVMIRRYRLGKSSPGDFRALAGEIVKAIDAYTFRHPGMTRKQVRAAVLFVGQDYEPDEDDEGSGDDGEDE